MRIGFLMTAMLALGVFSVSGCGQSGSAPKPKADAHDHDTTTASAGKEDGHDHSGWWCSEHGVPEEICAQCDSKLAADFQKKGDWCKKHDRPDSQCFVCHPELEAKFAAQYEAKYGKKPPKPNEG
jgi:hypothetical protein